MGFGVLLIVLGIGSILLNRYTDWQFILLSWADSYQPWAGIGFALLGVLIVVIAAVTRRRRAT